LPEVSHPLLHNRLQVLPEPLPRLRRKRPVADATMCPAGRKNIQACTRNELIPTAQQSCIQNRSAPIKRKPRAVSSIHIARNCAHAELTGNQLRFSIQKNLQNQLLPEFRTAPRKVMSFGEKTAI